MNINEKMRFEAAYELTRRVFAPRLDALNEKWTEADMLRAADSIAAFSLAGVDYSRLDNLEPGDVPEVEKVYISFSKNHLPFDFYDGPTRLHRVKSGSWDEQRAKMYGSLAARVPILSKLSGNYYECLQCTPVRVPMKHKDEVIKAASKVTSSDTDAGDHRLSLCVTRFPKGGFATTGNRQLKRLWKHYEALHALLTEGMEFHAHCYEVFKSCRTLKSLDEKWPEIGRDFREINNVVEAGKGVAVQGVAPNTLRDMNRMITKANAEQAKRQGVA